MQASVARVVGQGVPLLRRGQSYSEENTVLLFFIPRLRRCRNGNDTSGFGVRRRHDTLSRAIPSGLGIVLRCFPFLKRASFTEPSLNLNDGLDLRTGGPLLFGCQSEGIFRSPCAAAFSREPLASRHRHWRSPFKHLIPISPLSTMSRAGPYTAHLEKLHQIGCLT